MIYLKICGRLGNQMFQYAFAKKIQLTNQQQKIVIDFGDVNRVRNQSKDSTWINQLMNFNLENYEVFDRSGINDRVSVFDVEMNLIQKIILNAFRLLSKNKSSEEKIHVQLAWAPFLKCFGIVNLNHGYYQFDRIKAKNIFVKGFFENPRYFEDIKDVLFKEFTPKYEMLAKNKKLFDIIHNCESVCVSIRRGTDFTNSGKYNVCSTDYFNNAIQEMKKLLKDPVFIIFSDEMDLVRNEFNFDDEYFYFEDGDDPVWEKLRLMYSCKHFIISNSTFSWWAQYLSRNSNKKVIAPLRWWNNENNPEIYEGDWILMS